MGYGYIGAVKARIVRSKYLLYGAVLVCSSFAPLVVSTSTATASATFSNHPITTGYKSTAGVTTAGGSLWYSEVDPSAPNSWTYYDIGNMTTSGIVTDYNIRTLSGNSGLVITSLTTGSDGNVWFAGNNVAGGYALAGVLNISTGATTLYSSSIPVYNGHVGQIVSGSDGDLYYYVQSANDNNSYIIYVNPTTGATGTIGHSTYPDYFNSIAASSDGYIWVTNPPGQSVQSYPVVGGSGAGSGYFITGTTYPGNYPGDVVSGPDGNIWFTDGATAGGSYIYKLNRSSGTFTKYSVASASTLTAGPDGAVWFIDSSATPAKIGRISSSGSITEYAVPGTGANTTGGLTIGPDGALWFTYGDSGGLKLGRVVVTPDFSSYPTTSSYTYPNKVTTAGGSLWYLQGTTSAPSDSIGNMTTSGTVTDYNVGYPTGMTKFTIVSITTGPDGNIWFDGCANTTGGLYAGFLNISTGAVTFYKNTLSGISCNLGRTPGVIAAGSDGYVWYVHDNYEAAGDTGYLFSVNPSTGATVSNRKVVNSIPNSLTTGPDGKLYYTVGTDNSITSATVSAGVITGSSIHFPHGASRYPGSLAAGPDGNVWFVEGAVSEIAKLTPTGTVTEYAMASGVYPGWLTAGSDGAVWFSDSGSPTKIGRITTSGSVTEYTVPGTSVSGINGMTLGPDGAVWFAYGASGSKLGRLGY